MRKFTARLLSTPKDTALTWLWLTAFLNFGFGGIIWLWNAVAAENADYSVDYAEAIALQAWGAGLFDFGVAVLVLTFATTAIVDAILKPKA